MKKILLVLFALIGGLIGVEEVGAADFYAALSTDKTTLTFYYDNNKSSRSGSSMWESDIIPANANTITKVVFNSSVANTNPTTGYKMLAGLRKVTSITGLSYLKTSEMVNMDYMFDGCSSLTSLSIASFKTDKVTSMKYMFGDCSSLKKLELPWAFGETWTTTNMRGLFYNCSSLEEINGNTFFNTTSVTDMGYMFYNCVKLDLKELAEDLDTRNVTDMENMFYNCKKLTSIDINQRGYDWAKDKLTNVASMFADCSNLKTIYCNENWEQFSAITTGFNMFAGCSGIVGGNGTTYNSGKINLTMAHPDNSGNPGYFTGKETTQNQLYGVMIGTVFNIRYDKQQTIYSGISNISDLSYDDANKVTSVKIEPSVKNAKFYSTAYWFCSMPNLTTIEGLENIPWGQINDASSMFADDTKLTTLDLRKVNLTGTKCDNMFANCKALTTIYSDDDYSTTLKSSGSMFYGCTSLKGNRNTAYSQYHVDGSYARPDGGTSAPGYFTGVLKEMYAVLGSDNKTLTVYYDDQCIANGGDIYWSTDNRSAYQSKVTKVVFDKSMDNFYPTTMSRWFSDYSELKELAGMQYLHTDQVTNMEELFANCAALKTLDVSAFKTMNVETMDAMFMSCKGLTSLNVNSFFDGGNAVTRVTRMFAFCDNLRTIYCNQDWSTLLGSSVNSSYMFLDCKMLVGEFKTQYKADHTTIEYARPDGGIGSEGYFTRCETALNNVEVEPAHGTKVLRNGILLIKRNGKTYTVTGQVVVDN